MYRTVFILHHMMCETSGNQRVLSVFPFLKEYRHSFRVGSIGDERVQTFTSRGASTGGLISTSLGDRAAVRSFH